MPDWKALDILHEEHRAGLEWLEKLDRIAQHLSSGNSHKSITGLREILAFFNGELRMHFLHEEDGLFPVLARAIGEMGPIGAMKGEHRSIWIAVDAFDEAITEMESGGSPNAIAEVIQIASHILGLLRSHIQKEDQMLFPLADNYLNQQAKQEVVYRISSQSKDASQQPSVV